MPSFSLRAIFLIVAVAAFGAAAIVNANFWWVCAVTTATVLALVAATIAAGRPFYRVFCVMGWAYFLLTTGPTAHGTDSTLLPTRIMLVAFPTPTPYEYVGDSPAEVYTAAMHGVVGDGGPDEVRFLQYINRVRIAQNLLALVFGTVAGFVTQAVVARQARGAPVDAKAPAAEGQSG